MTTQTQEVQHIAELVDRAQISMLTTMTESGKHVSRPMALQEMEFDGDLWFFCYDDSAKARQIAQHPAVNVSFSNDKSSEWTSLSGQAEVVHDQDKADQLWSKPLKAWFPDGLETPGIAMRDLIERFTQALHALHAVEMMETDKHSDRIGDVTTAAYASD